MIASAIAVGLVVQVLVARVMALALRVFPRESLHHCRRLPQRPGSVRLAATASQTIGRGYSAIEVNVLWMLPAGMGMTIGPRFNVSDHRETGRALGGRRPRCVQHVPPGSFKLQSVVVSFRSAS